MTDNTPGAESSKVASKSTISPTSSFVDFTTLQSERYTPEGMYLAEEYEPYDERKVKKPMSDLTTCLHLLSGSVGAGLLGMNTAFQFSGSVLGGIGVPILSAICIYAMIVLIRTQYIQCKRLQAPFLTLPSSMKVAIVNGPKCLRVFSCCAPYSVDFMLVSNQIGCGTAYLIFIADSLKQLIDPLTETQLDKRIYIAILIIPMVLVNYIRDLKKLMPVSLVANFLLFFALLCIFYFLLFVNEWKIDKTVLVAEVAYWPLYMGIVLFAVEAPGLVVALEYNMKNPKRFLGYTGIFPWSMLVVVTVYTTVGLVGYLKFGPDEEGTIVSALPREHWLAKTVVGIYSVCIFCKYPLQIYVGMEIIWGNYLKMHIKNPNKECFVEFILRTVIVLTTVVLAVVLPNINIVLALVGTFCLSYLGLVFPFLISLCTTWYVKEKRCSLVIYRDIIFIIFGFLVFIIGTYATLYEQFK